MGTPTAIDEDMRRIDAMFAAGHLKHSPRSPRPGPMKTRVPAASSMGKSAKQNASPSDCPVLRVPAWEHLPWLLHGFSTRRGGVSTVYGGRPGCGDLNLGLTPTDAAENVHTNRDLFLRAIDAGRLRRNTKKDAVSLALLRQIHSGLIHRSDAGQIEGSTGTLPRGDGWISDRPGTLIGIQTADCLPVLIADVRLRIVAAFHAGWRGTLARIVERGVGRLRAEFGCRPGDLTAAIGPGIGVCCYSVGEEVRMEFSSQFAYADALFQEVFDLDPIKQKYPMLFLTARAPGHSNLGPSLHLDLAEANRRQLQDAGIEREKIHRIDSCTACNRKQFFSHRAEQGFTGRMLSVIGIAE